MAKLHIIVLALGTSSPFAAGSPTQGVVLSRAVRGAGAPASACGTLPRPRSDAAALSR